MGKLPGEVDGRRVVRALRRLGWEVVRQRGSHRMLVHRETGAVMTLAFHSVVYRNTLKDIVRHLEITEEEFLDVL